MLTDTLTEQEEVESRGSIPEPEHGNRTVEESHSPPVAALSRSPTPEPTPSYRGVKISSQSRPLAPQGERGRREILTSLYQRYMGELETSGHSQSCGRQKAAVSGVRRAPGRKNGVKPAGQRSGKPPSNNRAKDESKDDKKNERREKNIEKKFLTFSIFSTSWSDL